MATPFRIKRSAVPGKKPSVSDLQLGELALNTNDVELYTLRDRFSSSGIATDVVRIGAGATVTNILYVTEDGNDTNTGLKLGDAKKTIRAAVEAATTGTVIKVSAGTYVENNPIKIPDQVSIVGDSLREVTVTPQNQGDLFYVSNGNYIAEMSFIGAPNPGAIFAFNPDEIGYFDQSPYIQNCTNFVPNSIGLKIDGKYAIGPLKSMVLDSYTQYNQGGIGASMTNEGYAQLVSLFTICNNISVYCGSGAACDLTNSNSSFGNFALIAEGVGPLKYTGIVTSPSAENSDTFTLDLSVPELNITNALYDNVSGILTAYTDQPHQFSIGMGVSITGLEFSCPSGPGIVTYPSGNYGYVFETVTVAPGRYVDASNLIRSNRTEIQDKSLAAIAINHPDFIFPGDPASNSRYRYYDSYRLIQQNKQEIVGTAFTNAVNNPEFSSFDFGAVEEKCKRDLGYFIDAVATDVFTGGNTYSIAFTRFYFDGSGNLISNGILGEESESVYTFVQARELMKQAITNQLTIQDLTLTADPLTGFNTDPASCADVRSNIDNLVGIVTQAITAGNVTTLDNITLNPGTFTDGGSKCRRDIGLIVDAVANDLEGFTSKNILEATKAYFNSNGQPITNGLVGEEAESITAFIAVRDYSKLAINNLLNVQDLTIQADSLTGSSQDENSCADVKSTIDNLVGILTTYVGAGSIENLPQVSMASTVFSAYVGASTLPHTYESGGVVKINVTRPFDGQVVYFGELFYTVGELRINNSGSGYLNSPIITIEDPDTEFGVPAQAVAEIRNGSVIAIDMVSTGRGYTYAPTITLTDPETGSDTATATPVMIPTYYSILSSTPIVSGICTITINDNIPYEVGIGTEVPFFKQSRVLASGHSLEYIGSGTEISRALPSTGGVPIQENETSAIDGGLVVFTSTDQSGNFRIGDGVIINQQTGTISGTFYSKSLFSTLTPFILALGGD